MSNRSVLAALVLALAAMPLAAAAPETFGAGVSLEEATPITTLIQQPDAFEGKTVRVEGVVTAVCAHMGCWMALAAPEAPSAGTVLLKVDDGVVVFPVSAKGRRAVAQGVVQRVGGTAEGHEAAAEPQSSNSGDRPTRARRRPRGAGGDLREWSRAAAASRRGCKPGGPE
jgi:hypothetical protein